MEGDTNAGETVKKKDCIARLKAYVPKFSLRALMKEASLVSEDVVPHAAAGSFYHETLVRCAVLIPLFEEAQRIQVILTVRSEGLRYQPGHVCLPGGKKEPGDASDIDIALREAQEEIGLERREIEVIAKLEPHIARGNQLVLPVVGFLHDKQTFLPKINDAEVKAIFEVPLDLFLSADEHYSFQDIDWHGQRWRLHYFKYGRYTIWGLTAYILIHVARIVYNTLPNFALSPPDFPDFLDLSNNILHQPVIDSPVLSDDGD